MTLKLNYLAAAAALVLNSGSSSCSHILTYVFGKQQQHCCLCMHSTSSTVGPQFQTSAWAAFCLPTMSQLQWVLANMGHTEICFLCDPI
jgi:hypothetical protein